MQSSGILYCSPDDGVFLVDVPSSIAAASAVGRMQLLSRAAILRPYPSTEPTTEAARERVRSRNPDSEPHGLYSSICTTALHDLRASLTRPHMYCFPRVTSAGQTSTNQISSPKHDSTSPTPPRSEDIDPPANAWQGSETRLEETGIEAAKTLLTALSQGKYHDVKTHISPLQGDRELCGDYNEEEWDGFFQNPQNQATRMTLTADGATQNFIIPPCSAFLLRDCRFVSEFRAAAKEALQPECRGRFDFILLDPPWPNRSAARRGSYTTHSNTSLLKRDILRMDLDVHVMPGGYIAVWITNSVASRQAVLGHGGFFEAWNVSLVEEWIWLKVSAEGEPVTPIDGLWRKPYEVVLIGHSPLDPLQLSSRPTEVIRRILVGVPDLHSRKPCLKHLVERILLRRTQRYNALEVFARHLVAGWFSWGDEVLLYNSEGYWIEAP